jgi:L-alanine-DL-glutamate epimerase-like enolase superfamily enzyme
VKKTDLWDIEALLQRLDSSLFGASQAKAAIDCAMHDLMAKASDIPLHKLLGGALVKRIPVLRILALKPSNEMADKAAELYDSGYRYFKIKVHGDVAEDVARVRAIRERLGSQAHLTIDANQSYSVKEAICAIERMAPYGVDLVEQPVHRSDLRGLAAVTRAVSTIIEADEAAGTLEEISALVGDRLVDAVSLKIPKLGGLRNAIAAARLCEVNGVKCRVGAHVGTRLLNAHGLSLAASLPKLTYACELGEFARMDGDPFAGIEVIDGHVEVPDAVGCGVSASAELAWQEI